MKKIILDIILTLLPGCQMAYSLISEVSHEIAGLCMIAADTAYDPVV